MSSIPTTAAEAWTRLRALEPLIHDLQRSGHAEAAAAVQLARDLAEEALAARGRSTAETPQLLTTRQAGRALGVSIQTIRNWIAAGRLVAVKRGVRTMIPRQAVLDEIERSRAHLDHAEAAEAGIARRKRLLAALPREVVGPLDALHDKMERGEPLSEDERARMIALEQEMIVAAERLLVDEERQRGGHTAA
jgi:excisionase family DNA binding protein